MIELFGCCDACGTFASQAELYEAGELAWQQARTDAETDFTAACERTIAAGRCTGCEQDVPELLPWASHERLCWACADLQLDLLAIAVGELWADAQAVTA